MSTLSRSFVRKKSRPNFPSTPFTPTLSARWRHSVLLFLSLSIWFSALTSYTKLHCEGCSPPPFFLQTPCLGRISSPIPVSPRVRDSCSSHKPNPHASLFHLTLQNSTIFGSSIPCFLSRFVVLAYPFHLRHDLNVYIIDDDCFFLFSSGSLVTAPRWKNPSVFRYLLHEFVPVKSEWNRIEIGVIFENHLTKENSTESVTHDVSIRLMGDFNY